MNDLFTSDYLRMTGRPLKLSAYFLLDWIFRHNIRYSYWLRLRSINGNLLSKYACFRMSRKYGLEFSPNTTIGKGLYLGHPYNITVGDGVVMGNNINIHKGATIGVENRGSRIGAPIIGNQVYIGINATIIGNIHIGDDVMIAPNTFINFDVPSHSIVIGNPGQIIPREHATEGYIRNAV